MMMVPEPVEVVGSTLGGSDKVKVELDGGTEMGYLTVSFEGCNYGIPYVSLLGDSFMNPSHGYFDGSSDVPPKCALLGGLIEKAVCRADSWSLFKALIHCLDNYL